MCIRDSYEAVEAGFTRRLEETGQIAGKLVYTDPPQACEDLKNAGAVKGHIALIDRGVCFFLDKVKRAKEAGARAVVVVNNEGGPPIAMGYSRRNGRYSGRDDHAARRVEIETTT